MNTQKIIAAAVVASLGVIAASIVQTYLFKPTTASVTKHTQTVTPPQVIQKKVEIEVIDTVALDCMATNLYFEARNQKSDTAMVAVGYTVLNRVNSKHYPKDVCGVVYQGRRTASGNYIRNKCQFSWVCDGKPDVPNVNDVIEAKAWNRAKRVAKDVLLGTVDNPIKSATMYHATYVNPYWVTAFTRVVKIEDHIFYS